MCESLRTFMRYARLLLCCAATIPARAQLQTAGELLVDLRADDYLAQSQIST